MTQIVELPNGEEVEFPDNMSDEQISAAIRAQLGQAQAPEAAPERPEGAGEAALIGFGAGITQAGQGVRQATSDAQARKAQQTIQFIQDVQQGKRPLRSVPSDIYPEVHEYFRRPEGHPSQLREKIMAGLQGQIQQANIESQRVQQEAGEFAQTPVGQSLAGKVGQFAGFVAPTVPIPAAAATLPGRIAAGAALGTALGETTLVPGETLEQRSQARGEARAFGAGVGAALPPVIAGLRRVAHPLATVARRALDSPSFKKASQFLRNMGISGASVGEKSGSLRILQAEAGVKGSAAIEEMAAMNRFAASTRDAFLKIRKEITGRTRDVFQSGRRVLSAGLGAHKKLVNARSAIGQRDFALVDAAANGRSVFALKNTLRVLDDFLTETGGGGGATARSLRGQINRIKKMLVEGKITGTQAARLLSDFSGEAAGSGRILVDIGDRGFRRVVAGRVLNAIGEDLGSATGVGKKVKGLIDVARSNWKINSRPIEEIRNSALGSLINMKNATPEQVAERILAMRPSAARSMLDQLDKYAPRVSRMTRGMKLDQAIRAMFKRAVDDPTTVISVDPKAFARVLGDERTIAAWFRTNPRQVKRMLRAVDILGSRGVLRPGGRGGAQTAEQLAALAPKMDPTFVTMRVVGLLTPGRLRRALMTEEGQRALIRAANSLNKPSLLRTQEVVAAWKYLQRIENGNEVRQ